MPSLKRPLAQDRHSPPTGSHGTSYLTGETGCRWSCTWPPIGVGPSRTAMAKTAGHRVTKPCDRYGKEKIPILPPLAMALADGPRHQDLAPPRFIGLPFRQVRSLPRPHRARRLGSRLPTDSSASDAIERSRSGNLLPMVLAGSRAPPARPRCDQPPAHARPGRRPSRIGAAGRKAWARAWGRASAARGCGVTDSGVSQGPGCSPRAGLLCFVAPR